MGVILSATDSLELAVRRVTGTTPADADRPNSGDELQAPGGVVVPALSRRRADAAQRRRDPRRLHRARPRADRARADPGGARRRRLRLRATVSRRCAAAGTDDRRASTAIGGGSRSRYWLQHHRHRARHRRSTCPRTAISAPAFGAARLGLIAADRRRSARGLHARPTIARNDRARRAALATAYARRLSPRYRALYPAIKEADVTMTSPLLRQDIAPVTYRRAGEPTNPLAYPLVRPGPRSCSASGWRIICASRSATGTPSPGRAAIPFGGETFERPWFTRRSDGAARSSRPTSPSRCSACSACRSSRFHDRDIAPGGQDARRDRPQRLDEIADYLRKQDGRRPASSCCGARPTCSRNRRYMAGAATNPDPGGLRLRRRAGEDVHRRDPAAERRELRAVGRARGLRDAAQHRPQARARPARPLPHRWSSSYKHKIGFKGTILIEPKPQEPTKHQYDYDVATVYGFLQALRPGEGGQAQHRAGPRHPRRPHLRARARAGQRARHLRLDRHQPRRLPVRLGHRPVPQQRAGDGAGLLPDPAGRRLHHRRHQFRRQAAPPVDRSRRIC